MKASPWAITGIALASAAQAQVVQFDIEKRHGTGLRRRAFDASLNNDLEQGGYIISVQVGSPGQNISLLVDTGSSDTWVPNAQSSLCQDVSSRNPGCTLGSFDSSKSNTFTDVGQGLFSITYVDGTSSQGDYIQDDLAIGGVVVKNLTMGLSDQSSIPHGLVGVGYPDSEASVSTTHSTYPNLPVALQQQGLINSVAYSLWLNDLNSSTGSILFGGIDTEKYSGDLIRVNVLTTDGDPSPSSFSVSLYSVGASSPTGTDTLTMGDGPVVVVLDSGTTLTYLPQAVAEQAWEEAGATFSPSDDLAVIPCSAGDGVGLFSFGFAGPGGPTINVTINELVIDGGGPQPEFASGSGRGQQMCEFGIQNTTQPPYLLGDSVLRSAYIVYDLVNNQIALAQANFDSTQSNVVAFASEGAAIPSATSAPNQSGVAPPSSLHSGFSAQGGFESGGTMAMGIFSKSGLFITGLTIAYTVLGGTLFGIVWL